MSVRMVRALVLAHVAQALERELAWAQGMSEWALDAKRSLPSGASREQITSANARWASANEYRDRVRGALELVHEEARALSGGAA